RTCRCYESPCIGAVGEMSRQVYIVAIREVLPEMPAAALLATQRRAGDETGDGQEIAMAARLRGASVRPGGGVGARWMGGVMVRRLRWRHASVVLPSGSATSSSMSTASVRPSRVRNK